MPQQRSKFTQGRRIPQAETPLKAFYFGEELCFEFADASTGKINDGRG